MADLRIVETEPLFVIADEGERYVNRTAFMVTDEEHPDVEVRTAEKA